MNTLIETLKYFVFITAELIALFLLISAVVEIILMYIERFLSTLDNARRRFSFIALLLAGLTFFTSNNLFSILNTFTSIYFRWSLCSYNSSCLTN